MIYREKSKQGNEKESRLSRYRDLYHGVGGDEDMVSMVDQIIAGKGIFAGLYDKKD
jgi:hypothetical protein